MRKGAIAFTGSEADYAFAAASVGSGSTGASDSKAATGALTPNDRPPLSSAKSQERTSAFSV